MTASPWDEVLKKINPTGAKLEAGVVEAVAAGTADVNIAGSTVPNVRVAGGLMPAVGQYVWLIRQGTTTVALPRSTGVPTVESLNITRPESGYAFLEMAGSSGAYIDFKDSTAEDRDARIIYVSGSGQLEINPKLYVSGPVEVEAGTGNHIYLTDPSVIAHNQSSGGVNIGWDSDWYRFRFGGTSTPQGILISNYDTPTLYLARSGVVLASGSSSSPGYSFIGDSDTGFYPTGTADQIGVATGGTEKALFGTNVFRGQLTTGAFWMPYGAGSASAPTYSFYNDGDTGMYRAGTDDLAFATGGVRRWQIENDGALWMGTYSVSTSVSSVRVVFSPQNFVWVTRQDPGLYLHRPSTTGGVASFHYGTTQVGYISISTTNTTYSTSSDRRFKENITDYDPEQALSAVMSMQVREFDWKHGDPAERHAVGFIAQELNTTPAKVAVAIPNPKEEAEGWGWAVDYGRVTPFLAGAIQALKTKNDDLLARVEALEAAAT